MFSIFVLNNNYLKIYIRFLVVQAMASIKWTDDHQLKSLFLLNDIEAFEPQKT